MPDTTPGRRRPSAYSANKIAGILDAARRLFTQVGYEATSMDRVAAEAKVGKATVYAHFGSKAGLFAAVITNEGQSGAVALTVAAGEPVAVVLHRFGRNAFALLLAPTNTAFFRMIAAEHARFPELGAIFFEAGPARLQHALASALAAAMDHGAIRRADPSLAACHFLALICSDLQIRAFLGLALPEGVEECHAVVSAGVDAFLRAYATSPIN